jgi:Uma2 family endonuclease
MTTTADQKLITIEEFMAMPDTDGYELIDGQLVEKKSMGAESSYVAAQILFLLGIFLRDRKLGWVFGADAVYQCFGSRFTGRKPDCSFIRYGRLPHDWVPKGHVTIPPDLAIEVVSPNDLAYEVKAKAELYLSAGIPLVWVVYPEFRSVEIRRADGSSTVLHVGQEISGESVLPGFIAQIEDFFLNPQHVEPSVVDADDE